MSQYESYRSKHHVKRYMESKGVRTVGLRGLVSKEIAVRFWGILSVQLS
jgi:hypothetical protein